MKKNTTTTLLVIMDGWGVTNPKNKGNPVTPKNAPNYFSWIKKYPNTLLSASGTAVGLFKGEEGNSEAGHLNLGGGRVVKQDALYISDAINDGTFFKNNAFNQALNHVKKYDTAAHVIGLLSNHNSAHSCPEHLLALLELFRQRGIKKVFLHLFTDGRDSGQHDAPRHFAKLEKQLADARIATITGRFYAMDRNKNWARTQMAYESMVMGKGTQAGSAAEAFAQAYNRGETDEFIKPTVITNDGKPTACIKDNDVIFFFNLRSDRARQITKAFVQPNFKQANPGAFTRASFPQNTRFVAMTDFGPDLPGIFTAFPSRDVDQSLTQILCPRRQLYIAESEKFAHVTYFFNGGYGQHLCNESWVKIASPDVDSYDQKPEMSAKAVSDYVAGALDSGEFDFIAVNFANPDMVGHTGNFEAGQVAVSCVDKEVQKLIKLVEKRHGIAIITADHGNIEEMIDLKTGEKDTEHSTNPVPFILVGAQKHRLGSAPACAVDKLNCSSGKLADVAPTILKLMDIEKPADMTGKSLV